MTPFRPSSSPVLILGCVLAAGSLAGCSNALDDGRYPTGSSSVVATADYAAVVATNTDAGSVSVLDVYTRGVAEVPVGEEPTRIARVGDRLLVTLRGERALAELSPGDDGEGYTVTQLVDVGAEPYGVVASENGRRVYVAASMAGRVHELDGESLEILRSWRVASEPRWLALAPNAKSLYVASAFDGLLSWIDLDSANSQVVEIALPAAVGVAPLTGEEVTLTTRITGDPAVHPRGQYIAVPVLNVDNVTQGDPMSPGASLAGAGYYVQDSGTRFRPTLAVLPLGGEGKPLIDGADNLELTLIDDDVNTVGSYPTSVGFSPDGASVVVTMEASNAVAVLDVSELSDSSNAASRPGSAALPGLSIGFGTSLFTTLANTIAFTGAGPKGAVFLDDDSAAAWLHIGLDHRLEPLDLTLARGAFEANSNPGMSVYIGGGAAATGLGRYETGAGTELTEHRLAPELDEGRRLFYSAVDAQITTPGAGVSCSTCHFEGRNDGLNWPFPEPVGPRQTPSLAGYVSGTAPVTWDSAVETVGDEVDATSGGRMGGGGLWPEQRDAMVAWIDSTRLPDVPLAGVSDPAIERGREIFNRPDVACADCHSGALFTDNEPYAMFGLDAVFTRSLVGIAATAPYLHDGSAKTLRDVVVAARSGEMGDTSGLDEGEIDDLVMYLESL